MRLQKKSLSKVSLTDLLRRRKSTLEKYLVETGIVTYDLLTARCESSGLMPPSIEDFYKAQGRKSPAPVISSPAEGVVVIEPPSTAKLVSEVDGSIEAELSLEEVSTSDADSATQDSQEARPFVKKKHKSK